MAAEEQQDQGEVQTTSPPARSVSVEADSFFPGFHIHEVGVWIGARERPPRLFSSEPSTSMRPCSRTPPLSMPRELTAHPAGNRRACKRRRRGPYACTCMHWRPVSVRIFTYVSAAASSSEGVRST